MGAPNKGTAKVTQSDSQASLPSCFHTSSNRRLTLLSALSLKLLLSKTLLVFS